jgi:predicted aspartyl protease
MRFVAHDVMCALAIALLVQACNLPARVSNSASPRSIALRYDATLAAAGFPNPLLRLTIGGRTVWFIIDTGAGVHTIASWLVRAAGLRTRASSSAVTGSTGSEQQVRAFEGISARLEDGRTLAIPEGVVVDFPGIFEEHEIGGLLSPQLLSRKDAVVLDLRTPALSLEAFSVATARLRSTNVAAARVCHNAASPIRNGLYAVPATVAATPATLLLDTGATRTVIGVESGIAQRLAPQSAGGSRTQGVGGTVTTSQRVPGVPVAIAGKTTAVELTLAPAAANCGADGLLGMDVLRNCVLVLGESAFAWSCS